MIVRTESNVIPYCSLLDRWTGSDEYEILEFIQNEELAAYRYRKAVRSGDNKIIHVLHKIDIATKEDVTIDIESTCFIEIDIIQIEQKKEYLLYEHLNIGEILDIDISKYSYKHENSNKEILNHNDWEGIFSFFFREDIISFINYHRTKDKIINKENKIIKKEKKRAQTEAARAKKAHDTFIQWKTIWTPAIARAYHNCMIEEPKERTQSELIHLLEKIVGTLVIGPAIDCLRDLLPNGYVKRTPGAPKQS